MGKCLAGYDLPYCEITVCNDCFHKDVCGDKDYLTENECFSYCDNKELKAAREKQVAKKPVKADVQPYIRKKFAGRYTCPACNREVERRWNGCPYCLQRLKWEE